MCIRDRDSVVISFFKKFKKKEKKKRDYPLPIALGSADAAAALSARTPFDLKISNFQYYAFSDGTPFSFSLLPWINLERKFVALLLLLLTASTVGAAKTSDFSTVIFLGSMILEWAQSNSMISPSSSLPKILLLLLLLLVWKIEEEEEEETLVW